MPSSGHRVLPPQGLALDSWGCNPGLFFGDQSQFDVDLSIPHYILLVRGNGWGYYSGVVHALIILHPPVPPPVAQASRLC